jgi:hypothetical protein
MMARCYKIPEFRKIFLGMWDSVRLKMFEEAPGSKNVFIPKRKDVFVWI